MAIRQTEGRGRRYDSILDTVGDTPVVRLNRIAPEGVTVYVKAEAFNPAASVKDRLALNIIEAAERDGRLKPGQTVVETFSVERRRLMRFLGAKVVLTPKALKGFGMYTKAVELAEKNGWFLASQFETPDNADIHEATTAREILADFAGERLDYFVTGYGTGGTVSGVGRVLRRERPEVKIVLSEPANAALVGSGLVNGRNAAHQPTESHPAFQPHPIQGWTPDFIPWVLQEALDNGYADELIPVSGPEGMALARRLGAEEGILTGVSGGSTVAVAMKVAERAPEGSVILAMLPDTGERYLSTPLFEEIPEGMSAEERAIALSTPSAQLEG